MFCIQKEKYQVVLCMSQIYLMTAYLGNFSCLKKEVKANRLYNSILRWFREGRKSGCPFKIRFTGEETRLMRSEFCKLVKCILEDKNANLVHTASEKGNLIVYVLAFLAINLRDAVAIFSRVTDMSKDL